MKSVNMSNGARETAAAAGRTEGGTAPGRETRIPPNPRRILRRGHRPPIAILRETPVPQTRGGWLALAHDGKQNQGKRSGGGAGLPRANDQRREKSGKTSIATKALARYFALGAKPKTNAEERGG